MSAAVAGRGARVARSRSGGARRAWARARGGRSPRSAALLAVTALLVTGCGSGIDGTDDVDGADAPPPAQAPSDGSGTGAGVDGTGGVPDGLGDAVAVAVSDAAGVAGVTESAVVVLLAEFVTWPDGSLGCPEPDMAYTQALVDGYRIELEVAGGVVAYHGALGSPPFRCRAPEPPIAGGAG